MEKENIANEMVFAWRSLDDVMFVNNSVKRRKRVS